MSWKRNWDTRHDRELLENALTHSSYANEKWKNSLLSNERLEFLGDSILGFRWRSIFTAATPIIPRAT